MGYEGTIRFWDVAAWSEARVLALSEPDVRGMAFSPDERTIALMMEGRVQLWSVEDWILQAELTVDAKVISSIAFSPDGRWLATGAADNRIRIWDSVLR
jgi:WD40 repeat protein